MAPVATGAGGYAAERRKRLGGKSGLVSLHARIAVSVFSREKITI